VSANCVETVDLRHAVVVVQRAEQWQASVASFSTSARQNLREVVSSARAD